MPITGLFTLDSGPQPPPPLVTCQCASYKAAAAADAARSVTWPIRHERRRSRYASLVHGSSARPRGASLPLVAPKTNRSETCTAEAGDGAHKGDFSGFLVLGVIRSVLLTASRMPTTAARCRVVMTSQGTTSRFSTADLLASHDAIQPLKATNVARGHFRLLPAVQ